MGARYGYRVCRLAGKPSTSAEGARLNVRSKGSNFPTSFDNLSTALTLSPNETSAINAIEAATRRLALQPPSATFANAITVHSGGGFTNAVLLTAAINRNTTVAAEHDSVKLPPSAPGLHIALIDVSAHLALSTSSGAIDVINALSAEAEYALANARTSTVFMRRCW